MALRSWSAKLPPVRSRTRPRRARPPTGQTQQQGARQETCLRNDDQRSLGRLLPPDTPGSQPSVAPKPEFPPLLPHGLVPHSLPELEQLTVACFPASQTRPALWQSYLLITELRTYKLLPSKLWIDGSFLTHKVDPDDIDLCIEIDVDKINSCSEQSIAFLVQLTEHELHQPPRKLHTFIIPSANPGHPDRINYLALCKRWGNDFGKALVSREPKGIAILEIRAMIAAVGDF